MCGITGWVDFSRDLTAARPTIESMTRALGNRGPDSAAVWLDRHAALGHTRTAVIDLAGGLQPLVAQEDGRTPAVLSYSGEVYNFRELRSLLRSNGHRFRTSSDTEVVLRAYLEWGPDCVRRLEGMFAFAIWDRRHEELVLARDRLGIKPLFYARLPHGVLFGSEPKSLLANRLVRPVVDQAGLRELLSTAKTPGQAVFRDMLELPPGHTAVVSRRGISLNRYWRLRAAPHTDDLPTTITTVRELLKDIVRRELVADVPLCTALSGGLDSSALTAFAADVLAEQDGHRVRTITTTFEGYGDNFRPDDTRSAPDAPFAAEVVRAVGSDHVDIVLTTSDITEESTRLAAMRAQDMPTPYGDMDASLYRTFRRIRQHNTVALIGEGADEIFGGYIWLHQAEFAHAQTFPWVAMESLHDSCREAGMGRALLDQGLLAKIDMPQHYAEIYRQACAEAPHQDGESADEHRMRELCYLHLTRWLPMLLDRDDRLSMASGLEVRVPFCDHRLVEYLYNVPWSMKTYDGREKSLLRAAVADKLPQRVLRRPKSPWPVTQDPAYTHALQRELSKLLAGWDSPALQLIDVGNARRAADDTSATAYGWHSRMNIELVLQLDLWLRHYEVELAL
ncbi:asparagine synthase (glutamine-hydrolyzing) [Kibdelosporangium persicum]|uniref:asparagine synthase (glutamine-hydrolyzing) n=1 Tax=Kibdelosporangium persicum TaxID=2698649 RepID=A0ABX2FJH2_9PSEU|nr:asparagine synthase (glutamine-hydrolyzing) [Kibdelosporangium persicum]NRN71027.1 Asparagine synthetase, glutamine-hydrolysing [Kibdelosporangium persicum]